MNLYWRVKKDGKWTWERAISIPSPGGNTIGYGTLECFHYVWEEEE